MEFEFATAGRILFGAGRSAEAAAAAASFGRRALVIAGAGLERATPLIKSLAAQNVYAEVFQVRGEPTTDLVLEGTAQARGMQCDVVIAIGGGSAIDTGKAIAALLANGGDLFDYLEVIGRGKALARPSAPFIAIPTTAGTGSEVTRNAVLASPEHRVKVSLRSPLMLPRLAIVDPELTYSLPPTVTASTGLDALTQLVEPFVSNASNPLTDAVCREGMARVARSLRRAYTNGADAQAREDMSVASLFGGMALANARLGAAHGIAGPLGGMFDAPHGALCARLLPPVMAMNLQALRSRRPDSPALTRYDEVARIVTGSESAKAEDGAAWVRELVDDLSIPRLGAYGLTEERLPELVKQAQASSSMKGNPIALLDEEIAGVVREAL